MARLKKYDGHVTGVCSACGEREKITIDRWNMARSQRGWPPCKVCGCRMFPARRKCAACGAFLRNGNLNLYCAPCGVKKRAEEADRFELDEAAKHLEVVRRSLYLKKSKGEVVYAH